MDSTLTIIAGIVAGVLGVAIVSVLVSKNAQTGSVITSAGTALSGVIQAAVAPVSASSNSFGAAL